MLDGLKKHFYFIYNFTALLGLYFLIFLHIQYYITYTILHTFDCCWGAALAAAGCS